MKFQPIHSQADDSELASDLEWMLASNQVSVDILAAELTRAYFPELFHWNLLIQDNPDQAAYASLDAILAACLCAYRFPGGIDSRVWVFRQAARLNRQWLRRRRWRRLGGGLSFFLGPEPASLSQPATRLDAAIWLAFDNLPATPRLAAGLSWGLGLPPDVVASILERPEPEVARLLQLARQRIISHLAVFDLKPGDLPEHDQEHALIESLDHRYTQLRADIAGIENLAVEAADEVSHKSF